MFQKIMKLFELSQSTDSYYATPAKPLMAADSITHLTLIIKH